MRTVKRMMLVVMVMLAMAGTVRVFAANYYCINGFFEHVEQIQKGADLYRCRRTGEYFVILGKGYTMERLGTVSEPMAHICESEEEGEAE